MRDANTLRTAIRENMAEAKEALLRGDFATANSRFRRAMAAARELHAA